MRGVEFGLQNRALGHLGSCLGTWNPDSGTLRLLGLLGHAKWSLPMAIKEPKTFCVLLPVRGMSLIVAAVDVAVAFAVAFAVADVAPRNS